MNIGQLRLEELDHSYFAVIQLRHQTPGVLHAVILRPDKVKQTSRQCSMGHYHDSAVIVLGETPGDQAAGWQYPENVYVVAILGRATEKDGKWECVPVEMHDLRDSLFDKVATGFGQARVKAIDKSIINS